jgi:mono/diheme cytochrome c family protein
LALRTAGCDFPGRPDPKDRPVPEDRVLGFLPLYRQNCAGCHGVDGRFGPAPPLNDPLFLAIVSDAQLLRAIRDGRRGTPMPGFSRQRGGSLTDAQIQALAAGIKRHWKSAEDAPDSLPAYARPEKESPKRLADDPQLGSDVFARACAECHGKNGSGEKGGGTCGAIHEPAFLALISDQALRRIIITGRADLGMPSYAEKEGRPADFQPLTAAQIEDLVSLLAAWRASGETAIAADNP